ncbi:MAG TPA: hypothetical protein VK308_14585 [Pyrinomonadaceae bacterium]|nr:hypothetical protein [Pyrinomonadaceae bacterium]
MRQAQITIENQPVKTPLLNFIIATAFINSPVQNSAETLIEVRCDICSENAQATRLTLEAQGWGLYSPEYSFCPTHENSI